MNPVALLRYLLGLVNPALLLDALSSLGASIKTRDWRSGVEPLFRLVIPAALVAFLVRDCGAGSAVPPVDKRCGQDSLIPSSRDQGPQFEQELLNLRMLRETPVPVTVEIGDPGVMFAGKSEQQADGSVLITIDEHLDDFARRMVLVHEWAHALVWPLDDGDHGPHWGVAYAEAYRAGAMGTR